VSPESRNVFALRAARAANVVHGIPVKFRGQDLKVCLAPIAIGLDLDTGGLKQGGEFKCRFLAESLDSPPRRGEPLLYNGRTYLVTEITQPANMPGEHVVTLSPGSAQ
jgi:hypothetical protein